MGNSDAGLETTSHKYRIDDCEGGSRHVIRECRRQPDYLQSQQSSISYGLSESVLS